MKRKILVIVLVITLAAILFILTGCGKNSSTEEQNLTKDDSNYLADIVEIGDYVDIGIEYESTEIDSSYVKNTYANNEISGWRVLSVEEDGTIKLISAGAPLAFEYFCNVEGYTYDDIIEALPILDDLYTEIEVTSSNTKTAFHFTKNDFSINDLKTVFSSSKYVNTSAGIHGLTTDELINAYNSLLSSEVNFIEELNKNYILNTTTMLSNNLNLSQKAYDLFGIGIEYWLSDSSYEPLSVEKDGTVENNYEYFHVCPSVRIVITLNTGIEIAEDNAGDGSSSDMAYTLE